MKKKIFKRLSPHCSDNHDTTALITARIWTKRFLPGQRELAGCILIGNSNGFPPSLDFNAGNAPKSMRGVGVFHHVP